MLNKLKKIDIIKGQKNSIAKYANAYGGTFAVFPTAQSQAKKSKRATKPMHQDRHEMTTNNHDRKEGRSANTGLAKVAVQCSANIFMVNQSLILRIKICGDNRHLRQSQNRYRSCLVLFSLNL